jgi:hypothetical protein
MSSTIDLVQDFQARMVKAFAGEGEPEAVCREYLTDDFKCIEPPELPLGGTVCGRDAVLKIMDTYAKYWTVECLEMAFYGGDHDSVVTCRALWRWTAVGTAKTFVAPAVELFTIENNKIKSIEVFHFNPAGLLATLSAHEKAV